MRNEKPTTTHRQFGQNHPRGNAEIELVLCIPFLIAILVLIICTYKLGTNGMTNVFQAQVSAYSDATTANTPQYAGGSQLEPIVGLLGDHEGLPNRVNVAELSKQVDFSQYANLDLNLMAVTLNSASVYIAPAWSYSAYPVITDQDATEEWFTNYANEARGQYNDVLQLQPPWTP